MIIQPFFRKGDFYRRISLFNDFGIPATNQVISPNSAGMDSEFASYGSDKITILKDGRYLFIVDVISKGIFNNTNGNSGTCFWRFEKNATTSIVSLQSVHSPAPAISNGFQNMLYFNNGASAISGTITSAVSNATSWDCRFFYAAEIDLLSSDTIQQRWQQFNFVNGHGQLGYEGYVSLLKIT